MRNRRLAFTIDLLGEATITEAEADHVQKQYLDLLAGLTREVNAWPEVPADRPRRPRADPARQRVGQAVGAVQPVRPDRPGRHQPGGARTAAADPARWPSRPGAFVNFDMEQYASRTRRSASSARSSTEPEFRDWPRRRHRHPGVPARHRGRPAAAARLGEERARHAGLGAAGEGGVLGLRDGHRGPERLAGAGVHEEVAVRRQLREADRVPAGELRVAAAGVRQPQHPQPRARDGRGRAARACRRGGYEFQMLYGMADPIKDALSRSASACASTRRTANCCPAWRTSCAGCWRTRRTIRSCGPGLRRGRVRGAVADEPGRQRQRADGEPASRRRSEARTTVRRALTLPAAVPQRAAHRLRREENRAAMAAALDAVAAQFGTHLSRW